MSTNFETKDWGLAQAISYVIDALPAVKKAEGKPVFEFREEDRHSDYTYQQLQSLYYSVDGMAISNIRQLLDIGRDIRNLVLREGR